MAVMPVAPYFMDSPGSAATDEDTVATITPAILEAFEKKLERWHSDESSAKMIICHTVSMEIRIGIVELPSARMMWEYLGKHYCGPSQAQLYTFYQTVSNLQ